MYAEEAIDLFKANNEERYLASAYIFLGKTHMSLNDHEEASNYANKALELAEKNNYSKLKALAYNDLGWNYYSNGEFQLSLENNLEALEIRRDADMIEMEISSNLNLANLLIEWERYEDALVYLRTARELIGDSDSYSTKGLKRRYFLIMSRIYQIMGNYKYAWENYKDYHAVDVEINQIINSMALNNIKHKYEIDRYEKEKNSLSNIQQSEIKKQKIIIISILIIALLTIFSVFFIYSKYILRKKLNKQLAKTNRILQKVNKQTNIEIAEKKKMEKIINANADHLKLINKILRHDLTNDLATIKSGLSIYKVKKEESMLEILKKRIGKSVNLIRSMREFEEFMLDYKHLKVVSVERLFNSISDNYRDIQINIDGSGCVMAEDSLMSVFENLIRNAVDHGGVNSVDVKITAENSQCRIEISDNGTGIPEEIKEKIFEEGFFHGESGNTGMGLFIVKSTIESFGGKVEVFDNEPQGTTFVLTLRSSI